MSALPARSVPSAAADSIARSDVVPTATTRLPRCVAASIVRHGLRRHGERLDVHAMSRQIVAVDRLEGAGADMQRDVGELDAALAQCIEDGGIEVQARSRRRDGAGMARVDRLIAGVVERVGRSRDVGRQRHLAMAVEVVDYRDTVVEAQKKKAAVALDDRRRHIARQIDARSDTRGRGLPCTASTLRPPPRRRSSISSTLPPVGLRPNTRERTTRVSLKTSTSPGASSPGVAEERSSQTCRRSTCSSRLDERMSGGRCAISSGGRSKSKSERRYGLSGGRIHEGVPVAARLKRGCFSAIMRFRWREGNSVSRVALRTGDRDHDFIAGALPCSRDGGIGRRAGLKIQFWQQSGGSIPPPGTKLKNETSRASAGSCFFIVHKCLALARTIADEGGSTADERAIHRHARA